MEGKASDVDEFGEGSSRTHAIACAPREANFLLRTFAAHWLAMTPERLRSGEYAMVT
uniref:Uncharacterized protein n=1 Tax=Rhizobium rhizogenes TaxID=359 RepID=A0A7S4ZUI1_RHIRH|nr:hypothetical protein pC6.5d_711 [Rhizobium rhizogenes]